MPCPWLIVQNIVLRYISQCPVLDRSRTTLSFDSPRNALSLIDRSKNCPWFTFQCPVLDRSRKTFSFDTSHNALSSIYHAKRCPLIHLVVLFTQTVKTFKLWHASTDVRKDDLMGVNLALTSPLAKRLRHFSNISYSTNCPYLKQWLAFLVAC